MIEKDYLTFDELSARWRCEKNDIHYLIASRDIVPSIIWNAPAIRCAWEPDLERNGELVLVAETDFYLSHSASVLHGWFYLKLPTVLGPHKYSFSYVANDAYAKADEVDFGVWYRLLESSYEDATAEIGPEWLEANAVFMMAQIDDCETILRPDLLERKKPAPSGTTPANAEKSLATIERNTLLAIIAALCDYSAIKHQERGAASQIAKLTEELGAAVSDDTVRRALAKIPDALETRVK